MEGASSVGKDAKGPRAPGLFMVAQCSNLLVFVIAGLGMAIMLCRVLKDSYGILGALAILAVASGMVWVSAKLDQAEDRKWDEIDREVAEEYKEHQEQLRKQAEKEFEEKLKKAESEVLRQETEQVFQEHAADRARRHKELRKALEAVAEEVSQTVDDDTKALSVPNESTTSKVAAALSLAEGDSEEEEFDESNANLLIKAAERGRLSAEAQVQRRQLERVRRLRDRLQRVQLPAADQVEAVETSVGNAGTPLLSTSAKDVDGAVTTEVRTEAGDAVAGAMRRASLRHRRAGGGASATDDAEQSS